MFSNLPTVTSLLCSLTTQCIIIHNTTITLIKDKFYFKMSMQYQSHAPDVI